MRGASGAKTQRVLIKADAGSGMWINLTDQRTDTPVVLGIPRNLAVNPDSTVRKRTRGDKMALGAENKRQGGCDGPKILCISIISAMKTQIGQALN